ncbi:hypothetical protein V6Z11_A07G193000 [Gossypium hirsutum]
MSLRIVEKTTRLKHSVEAFGRSVRSKRSVEAFILDESKTHLPLIQLGDRIDYRNMSLISRFISKQGKILSRRVNRLTLKQQRLITIAIKHAHILSSLPSLNNEK